MTQVRMGRRSRTTPVVIPCDQVDRFFADNPDGSWSLRRAYNGQAHITGANERVTVTMSLGRPDGRIPRVGDRFDVIQNPANPRDVSFPQRSVTEIAVAACLGGLGVFLLVIAFFWF